MDLCFAGLSANDVTPLLKAAMDSRSLDSQKGESLAYLVKALATTDQEVIAKNDEYRELHKKVSEENRLRLGFCNRVRDDARIKNAVESFVKVSEVTKEGTDLEKVLRDSSVRAARPAASQPASRGAVTSQPASGPSAASQPTPDEKQERETVAARALLLELRWHVFSGDASSALDDTAVLVTHAPYDILQKDIVSSIVKDIQLQVSYLRSRDNQLAEEVRRLNSFTLIQNVLTFWSEK
jgi:hypothetical protein